MRVSNPAMHHPPSFISLLDDDPSVLKAMTRLLCAAGWTVTSFASPDGFLEHAASSRPPAAVIDLCMPVMDGLEVQAELRKISPATRVIFLTSRDDAGIRERALQGGAYAYLLKPADDDELLAVLKSATTRELGPADVPTRSRL